MRRIILSRKGFDSAAGRGASPLLDDGRLVSIPVPESRARRPTANTRYADLRLGQFSYLDLLRSLYPRRTFTDDALAHLDPDLLPGLRDGRPRDAFRGLFGQVGPAAQHLRNEGVNCGDLS